MLFGDLDLVKQTAEEIDVTLNETDFEPKRIGSINDSTGRHLLLSKFQSDIKRKVFFRKYKNSRSSNDFSQIYVDPNLTKSEREAQFQVRQEKNTSEQTPSENLCDQKWTIGGKEMTKSSYSHRKNNC